MTRTLLVCLMACGLAISAGCACGPCWNAPFGPGTVCDLGGGCNTCGPAACGPVCQPACESSCAAAPAPLRGSPCSTCGEVCGGACGASCGDPCCVPCGPLTWFFAFLTQGYCGESCGETWWGDWHGAPPDCCDPCDRCGNFTGRGGVAGGAGLPGGTGTCESCGQSLSSHVRRISTSATAEPEPVPERYAPRLVSTTDRVVARSVPQRELPRQQPAHQGR